MTEPSTVRVALVLNGGVSLAVWMGGVTHELDRLRRIASPAWLAVTEACGKEVVVDLVAGTSAGGLNGSLLASAIARGAELPDLLEIWRERGKLIRPRLLQDEPGQATNSLLDGDFFYVEIEEVLSGLELVAEPQDVTLLVTSTALYGSSAEARDVRGVPFRAGDHRRVYRFRRRQNAHRWQGPGVLAEEATDDFDPEVLASAARASSGFPFAFEPWPETDRLRRLNRVGARGDRSWLIDGGVLDNAPFGPLLTELTERPCTEPGERWIVYVVPSVEPQQRPLPVAPGIPPRWFDLPGRLFGLSRESDLRDDVLALVRTTKDTNLSLQRPERLIAAPQPPQADDIALVGDLLFERYRATRARGLVARSMEILGTYQLEAGEPSAELLGLVLSTDLCFMPTTMGPTRVIDGAEQWQWGLGAARRIARWVSRDVRGVTGRETLLGLSSTVGVIEEKLEALDVAYEAARQRRDPEELTAQGQLAAASAAVRQSGVLRLVAEVMSALITAWAAGREEDETAAWNRVLGVEVVLHAMSGRDPDPPPAFSLLLVSPDTPSFETVLASDFMGGPLEDRWPNNKLYGTRLGHFGAFGTAGFRDWDWMWGRVDGALTIADALLLGAPIDADQRTELRNALIEEILEGCGTDPEAVSERLPQVLALSPGQLVAASRDAVDETNMDGVIDDLVQMVMSNPLLERPVSEGWVAKVRARGRVWLGGKLAQAASHYLKRLVAAQEVQPPGSE